MNHSTMSIHQCESAKVRRETNGHGYPVRVIEVKTEEHGVFELTLFGGTGKELPVILEDARLADSQ